MAIDGNCKGAFSTRRLSSNRYTDFCPPNTARHVISSGGCSLRPNNLMIMCSSKCSRTDVVIDQTYLSPSRYTTAVIMNSTYDYDPASRKDDIVDIVASVLNIVVPLLRPDIAIMVGAFPWCELISPLTVSCSITNYICFKYSISLHGFLVCHSRGKWRWHGSFRSSISIGRLSTLFKKR